MIEQIEEELDDASGGANVWSRIQAASAPPTADALWQIERSWEEVPSLIDRVNQLISVRLPRLMGQVYTDVALPEPGDLVAMPQRGG